MLFISTEVKKKKRRRIEPRKISQQKFKICTIKNRKEKE
jgi:hypothetical protein